MPDFIRIVGAKQHNLKNVSLDIPKRRIVVFTGVSGSGKSSLVFDTVCAEAQRQLIETFSAFARRRLPKISKPHVEEIENLSTAMVIDQKRLGTTLRSTVGTVTEIFTHLRMLYSRCGEPFIGFSNAFSFNNPEGMCPACQGVGKEMVVDMDRLLDREKSVEQGAVLHSNFKPGGWYWKGLMKCGFFDPRKPVKDFTEEELHNLLHRAKTPFTNVLRGEEYTSQYEGIVTNLKRRFANRDEGEDAYTRFFTYQDCATCRGSRISEAARGVKVQGVTIPELVFRELPEVLKFVESVRGPVAEPLVRKMKQGLANLIDIGVGYLSLHRPVATLSGGESQRVKMATQLSCNLVDLMYILDEPSIGLHPRDVGSLLRMLVELKDKGNSLLVVEHDPAVIRAAEYIVDMGPGAGSQGGEVLFAGPAAELAASGTLTARYLGRRGNGPPARRTPAAWLEIADAAVHNLKHVTVRIPTGVFVCVTGVAGSGKSSLVHDVFCREHPEAVVVDQSPVGRSSRSNPATYVGVFDAVRREFAEATGSSPALFSFNSDGACPKCKGLGVVKVDLSFLDDVTMTCDECDGKRYKDEVLALRYKDKNIFDVLEMTVGDALGFFEHKEIRRKLRILERVGLDYLELGQSLSTLSGGEAQRIKLASELHKKGNLYVMDEPTTGLHMADTDRLLGIIGQLVGRGNSVIVIEHNLDVIRQADWVIDLGPDGGAAGGYVVAEGPPEAIAAHPASHTGRYLKEVL